MEAEENNSSDLQGSAGGRGTGHRQTQPNREVCRARLQKGTGLL